MPYKTLTPQVADAEAFAYGGEATVEAAPVLASRTRHQRVTFISQNHTNPVGGIQRASARLYNALQGQFDLARFDYAHLPLHLLRKASEWAVHPSRADASVVYCDATISGLIGTIAYGRTRNRIVATVHGLDMIAPLAPYQALVRRMLTRVDHLVCVSRATAEQASSRGADPTRITVVPNVAEEVPELPLRNAETFDRLEALTGFDLRNRKVLFSLGRPVVRKGFAHFIETTFPLFDDDYVYVVAGPRPTPPRWLRTARGLLSKERYKRLQIACGCHTCHDHLVTLASNHPRVIYLNNVSEEVRNLLYSIADVMVVPNQPVLGDMEGFGIVVLEASARGLPVVASRLEGITDAVTDGANGLLVDHDDPRAIHAAITSVVDQRRRTPELAQQIREFTYKTYSMERIATTYTEIFDHLFQEMAHERRLRL